MTLIHWQSNPFALTITVIALLFCHATLGESFPGWQSMQVVLQEGYPDQLHHADIDADGRDELIVVNTRHSRLEIYQWLPTDDRSQSVAADPERPNELPMAPNLDRQELVLEQLPYGIVAHNLDDDDQKELLILVSSPKQVLLYDQEDSGDWKQVDSWDLLTGSFVDEGTLMLLRSTGEQAFELLINMQQGIQCLSLTPNSRPTWFEPREQINRANWWLADLDHDGDEDLVEWTYEAKQNIRWYETVGGRILPPQVLYDQPIDQVQTLNKKNDLDEILLLGGQQKGILRRYQLSRGEESLLGLQQALSLPESRKTPWCGIQLDDQIALVAADPSRPRLLVYKLGEQGWLSAQTFPVTSNIKMIVAPQAHPGTLLLWAKGAADLHISRWENGRLTYPKPMPQSAEVEDRRILALGSVNQTCWWTQKVEDHIDLYQWNPKEDQPQRIRFENIGAKADRAVWIGGKRLLMLNQYAQNPKLVERKANETIISEPVHLHKAKLDEFHLFDLETSHRLTRLTDGVVQWLDDNLHPQDQVMLPEAQRLVGYVPLPNEEAWGLERRGRFIHRLAPDHAGIQRVTQSIYLPGGGHSIRLDPILGLFLITRTGVTRLSPGYPFELDLLQSIDSRVGRPSGVKESTIHRIFTTNATGNSQEETVLSDDRRHQLTVMSNQTGKMEPLISWPVYEDKSYPYGGQEQDLITEPRAVIGLNLDGDEHQDLVLLSHDRILFYLGRRD